AGWLKAPDRSTAPPYPDGGTHTEQERGSSEGYGNQRQDSIPAPAARLDARGTRRPRRPLPGGRREDRAGRHRTHGDLPRARPGSGRAHPDVRLTPGP